MWIMLVLLVQWVYSSREKQHEGCEFAHWDGHWTRVGCSWYDLLANKHGTGWRALVVLVWR